MTVSTTTNKVSISANGSQTVFAYNFKIFADGDLTVIIRAANGTETTKTLTTHYTVSGAGSASGGNVTFTTGNTPADGETVVIVRQLTKTQGTDYVANDPFPAESHEDALDRLTFITQELQEELDRSFKISKTTTITTPEFTDSASDRASKLLGFSSDGQSLQAFADPATDVEITSIAGLTSAANKIIRYTGSGTADLIDYLDQDDMSSNSASAVASQQSIKAFVESGTSTLTNKTLTAPKFANGGFLGDANGNEVVKFTTNVSAVNEITLANAATGNNIEINATGGDTNISLNINPKGSGTINIPASKLAYGSTAVTATGAELNIVDGDTSATSTTVADPDRVVFNDAGTMKQVAMTDLNTYFAGATATLTNKTLTAPKFADGGFIGDANGNEVIKFVTTASAVNELQITPSATGNNVELRATGDDTNISFDIQPKGSGTINIAANKLGYGGVAITATGTELNILDGNTSATSTTVADADRVVLNDDGTMKQVAVTDLSTYFGAATVDQTIKTSSGGILNLQTSDDTVTDGSVIGAIDFKAPDESSGGDAVALAASVFAEAEGTFASDANATSLVFKTASDAAATEKMRIDSTGRLNVGTNSATSESGMNLKVEATGNVQQLLKAGTDSNSVIAFGDPASNTSGEITYVHNGDRMEFDVNGSEKLRIETSGQVTLAGSTTAFNTDPTVEGLQLHYKTDAGVASIGVQHDDGFGNLSFQTSPVGGGATQESFRVNGLQNIVMAAGKGIDFANNAHATGMSSELFDDYEEGSFVGTLGGATSDPSTAVTATGTYTKIGRLVYAAVGFTNVNTTGASGMIQVTGWPYNSSTTMPSGDVMFYNVSNVRTDTANISAFWASGTQVRFYQTLQGTNIWVAAEHSAGSGRYLYVSVTYETS